MKKFKFIIILICFTLVSSCSKSMVEKDYEKTPPPTGNTNPPEVNPGGETVDLSVHPALQNRKVIYTVNLGVVSTDPSSTYSEIINNLNTYDAFIESEEITGKLYKIKLRVKSSNLTGLVNLIQNHGETINYVKTSEDITNTYSTLQAKLTALQAQHARILELIEEADNLSTILTLEAKRLEIEAELNEIGLKLNNFDSLIEYSTINLTITKIDNASDLLPQNKRPEILIDKTNTKSFTVELTNLDSIPTTMYIKITLNGESIKELNKSIYQDSTERVSIDGLKPGNQYKVEVISQAINHKTSEPHIIYVETDKTFFSSVADIFIASLNALLSVLKFIALAIIAILPFAILITVIGVPMRKLYLKKKINKKIINDTMDNEKENR